MAIYTSRIAQLAALGPTLCLALISANAQVLSPVVAGEVFDQDPRDGVPDFVDEGLQAFLDPLGGSGPIREVRGVLEFDLRSIDPANVRVAVLTVTPSGLTWSSFRDSPIPVQLFGFAGDGELQLNDFEAGSFITSLNIPLPPIRAGGVTRQIDVSAFIQSEMNFAGFNLFGTCLV